LRFCGQAGSRQNIPVRNDGNPPQEYALTDTAADFKKGALILKLKATIFIAFIISMFCAVSANAVSEHEIPIDIAVNNDYIHSDISSYISKGTVFSPIRLMSDIFEGDIKWDDNTKTATLTHNGDILLFTNDSNIAEINGEKVKMPAKSHIINGRLFVPVRFAAEQLGNTVDWDKTYYKVNITTKHSVSDEFKKHSYYEDNIFWLARIIEAESSGEPLHGKIAVGNVVLNRVNSKHYPNSIYDVIFDRKFGTQFQPVSNGTIYNTPSSESVVASKKALRGENTAGECLYFLNPKISTNTWIINNRTYYKTIHNHDFYL